MALLICRELHISFWALSSPWIPDSFLSAFVTPPPWIFLCISKSTWLNRALSPRPLLLLHLPPAPQATGFPNFSILIKGTIIHPAAHARTLAFSLTPVLYTCSLSWEIANSLSSTFFFFFFFTFKFYFIFKLYIIVLVIATGHILTQPLPRSEILSPSLGDYRSHKSPVSLLAFLSPEVCSLENENNSKGKVWSLLCLGSLTVTITVSVIPVVLLWHVRPTVHPFCPHFQAYFQTLCPVCPLIHPYCSWNMPSEPLPQGLYTCWCCLLYWSALPNVLMLYSLACSCFFLKHFYQRGFPGHPTDQNFPSLCPLL